MLTLNRTQWERDMLTGMALTAEDALRSNDEQLMREALASIKVAVLTMLKTGLSHG